MGANAQTTVQKFVDGAVLTAEQQNFSAATGVPVFATTVTRDAAFGGANKVLAEGQLAYIEASNIVQYYDGAAWATVGPTAASGLVLITAQTILSAVPSVVVSDVFSSTYENYLVTLNGGVGSTTLNLRMILGATTTGYYYGVPLVTFTSDLSLTTGQNATHWRAGEATVNASIMSIVIQSPQLAKISVMATTIITPRTDGYAGAGGGYLNDTTQYTGFTITPSTGTLTGGVIRVYGYQNS